MLHRNRFVLFFGIATTAYMADADATLLETDVPPGVWSWVESQCVTAPATCDGLKALDPSIIATRCVMDTRMPSATRVPRCYVQRVNCDDHNAATQDGYSRPAGGCLHLPIASCTGDPCANLQCFNGKVCHADSATAARCVECNTDIDCNDGDPCTANTCSPQGTCMKLQTDDLLSADGCCVHGQRFVSGQSYCGQVQEIPQAQVYQGYVYTCAPNGAGSYTIQSAQCGGRPVPGAPLGHMPRPFDLCSAGVCFEQQFTCTADADCHVVTGGCDLMPDGRAGYWNIVGGMPCGAVRADGNRYCARSSTYTHYYCGDNSFYESKACACDAMLR